MTSIANLATNRLYLERQKVLHLAMEAPSERREGDCNSGTLVSRLIQNLTTDRLQLTCKRGAGR